ncbi:MAG: hypothetical protein B6I25_04545 [Planctomycetales bacterium 4572_13]|nr:MAG: hypothetical protein B6I25_04545 [Planctomycetales bacterium 4572_13]
MNELNIRLNSDANTFAPGQTVEGTISWKLDEDPQKLTLALHWYTQSGAVKQSGMADSIELERPAGNGSKDFSFEIPQGPYSFQGRLLSLNWVLELAPLPGIDLVRQPITVSPMGGRGVLIDK